MVRVHIPKEQSEPNAALRHLLPKQVRREKEPKHESYSKNLKDAVRRMFFHEGMRVK